MKPICRLRMRARSLAVRLATDSLARMYSPSEGVSSRPRMESSVVLPHPDGPSIATYSPGWISMWMSWSACVSTSFVYKPFLMPDMRINDLLSAGAVKGEEEGVALDSGAMDRWERVNV